MRRLRPEDDANGCWPLTSPVEIITRASSTLPPDAVPHPEHEGDEPPRPALQPNRRARRRLRDVARATAFYGVRIAAGAAALAVLVGVPLWIWQTGAYTRARDQASVAYESLSKEVKLRFSLSVGEVTVEGSQHTAPEALRAALGLSRGDSLFTADPWIVRRRIEALPWVKSATVERRYPHTLIVRIVERTATARYREGRSTMLIDEAGAVIPVTPEPEHEGLIVLAGAGAPAAAPALLKLLDEEPALARRVSAASRIGNRRWDVTFDSGATLRLPEGAERAAWSRFIELNRQHDFLARGSAVFDMRLPDRLVVRGAEAKENQPANPPPAEKLPAAKKPRKTG
jgi:cell division protein FtsQ